MDSIRIEGLCSYYIQEGGPALLPSGEVWGSSANWHGWTPSLATISSWGVPEERVQELRSVFSADNPDF